MGKRFTMDDEWLKNPLSRFSEILIYQSEDGQMHIDAQLIDDRAGRSQNFVDTSHLLWHEPIRLGDTHSFTFDRIH